MSIWPASLSVKGALKPLSWFSPTFSGALVNATVSTLLLKSFAGKKRFSRGVLANTARFLRFFSLETLPFFAPDSITDFGIALEFCRTNSSTAISLSALSFDKSTDQKLFLTEQAMTNGLTSFICLWCNARIVNIGRKVRYPLWRAKVAVRLWLPPDGTRSYGIVDTIQQPQQN